MKLATRNPDIPTHTCCIIPLITTRMQHEIYTLAFVLYGADRWRSSRETLVRARVIFALLFVHNQNQKNKAQKGMPAFLVSVRVGIFGLTVIWTALYFCITKCIAKIH